MVTDNLRCYCGIIKKIAVIIIILICTCYNSVTVRCNFYHSFTMMS